jgi:hypothetical protein
MGDSCQNMFVEFPTVDILKILPVNLIYHQNSEKLIHQKQHSILESMCSGSRRKLFCFCFTFCFFPSPRVSWGHCE